MGSLLVSTPVARDGTQNQIPASAFDQTKQRCFLGRKHFLMTLLQAHTFNLFYTLLTK